MLTLKLSGPAACWGPCRVLLLRAERSRSLKTRPLISTDKTFYVAKEIAGCTLNGEYVAVVVCPPWRGSAVFHFMLHFTATAEHLHRLLFQRQ